MTPPALDIETFPTEGDRHAAAAQLLLSMAVLVILCGAAVVGEIAFAHDRKLLAQQEQLWKLTNSEVFFTGYFSNADDRLVYKTLPDADYSNGGVYFIGASGMQRALMLWNLPPQLQNRIWNYAVVGGNITKNSQFLDYLVQHENLLKAGGDKTCIITELSFAETCHDLTTAESKFADDLWRLIFTSRGLFIYSPQQGLQPVPMPNWQRRAELFDIQTHVFWSWELQSLQSNAKTQIMVLIGKIRHRPPSPADISSGERHSVPETRDRWLNRLGPDWEAGMDSELQQYSVSLDDLIARHVHVAAVYLPEASWSNGFAPAARFRQRVLGICRAKGVPMLDLQHRVPDTGFDDSVHLNYVGAGIVQPDLLAFAQSCLKITQTGTQP